MSVVIAFPVALALALGVTPLLIGLARRTAYLDQPQAHKLHGSAMPLLGGVAVFVSAFLAWFAIVSFGVGRPQGFEGWQTHAAREVVGLIGGSLVALVVGLWDDRFGMQPLVKLVGQASAAAILLVSSGVPTLGLGILDAVITLVLLVALMNAVNFLDNMNGVVAGLAPIALAAFAWTSAQRGAWGVAAAQLAVAGACIGFLRYNFPKARIFLGDAGSLFLGYSLGASAVLAFTGAPPGWGRLGPVLVLAYPAFDMIFVVVTRLRDGRKVYQGGRDHSNHRLASVLEWKTTVILLWLSGAALSASGLVVLSLNQPTPALLLSVLWILLLSAVGIRLSFVPIAPRPSSP